MTNFDHIDVGTCVREQYEMLEEAISGTSVTLPSMDELTEVIENENMLFFITSNAIDEGYHAYYVSNNSQPVLERVEKGSAYVVLKDIMYLVRHSDESAKKVTNVMRNSYSPLDLLFEHKGALGEDIVKAMSRLNKWEVKEIEDFLNGMSYALSASVTMPPSGSDTVYQRPIDRDEYEDVMEEDDYYDEGLDEEYYDEIAVDYGEPEDDEHPVVDLKTFTESEKHRIGTSDKPNKKTGLAVRLLEMFKRK